MNPTVSMGITDTHDIPNERVVPPASVPSTRSPSPTEWPPLTSASPPFSPTAKTRFIRSHRIRSPPPSSRSPERNSDGMASPPSLSSRSTSCSPTPSSSPLSPSSSGSSIASYSPTSSPTPSPPQSPPPPTAEDRFSVLSYEQVQRLHNVMTEPACIVGKGNFPVIEIRPMDLIQRVCDHCEREGVIVRGSRLNGGGASHVLCGSQPYNDLDLIFHANLRCARSFETVKMAVLSSLRDLLPDGVSRDRLAAYALKEAYVSKLVKVSDEKTGDLWSLIAVGHRRAGERGRTIELKFVDTMLRQFEFSVDSFQILLDSLISFYDASKMQKGQEEARMSESFFPSVIGESVYGDFSTALEHLYHKVIATRTPEKIRGGGLLKYCSLLARGFHGRLRKLEPYMCSRFFIDFSTTKQQNLKFTGYLDDHFEEEDGVNLRSRFLEMLFTVISESTVCLMGHERMLTLTLIYNLSMTETNKNTAPTVFCYYGPPVPAHHMSTVPCMSCMVPYNGNCWVSSS